MKRYNDEIYIDTDVLQASIDLVNKRINMINDVFNKTNFDMEEIQKNEYWTGRTSEVIFEKYDKLKSNYETVITSLHKLNDFMQYINNAYLDFDKRLNSSVEKSDLAMW